MLLPLLGLPMTVKEQFRSRRQAPPHRRPKSRRALPIEFGSDIGGPLFSSPSFSDGTTGVFLFIAGAMIIVFAVIGAMGPRTTRLRLEEISS